MKITLSVEDIPTERVLKHPHKFVAGETCLNFTEEELSKLCAGKPIREFVSEEAAGYLKNMLHSWDY